MAATFTFKLGTLDLSSYCRMNPEDKLDPYGQPWLQPAFTETPFADGQPLISTTVGNREQMWNLFLNEPSKDQLHALIQKINVAANQRPLQVEWQDDGASKPTFFDVAFLRFEPDFNFRRSQKGYAAGVLHIWVSGYGHTGTVRVAGTAAGTGVFLSVPIGSVAGDAPALLDTTITAGAVVPVFGRIVALAPITNPSYSALIPAASLLEAQPGATLVGASGAQGSQYLGLPISPTGGASGVACKVPLQNPTIMGGDNRILAVVRSGIQGGVGIHAVDPYGNTMGATAVASMTAGWGIVDLGVCRLPTVGFPTRPELSLVAGALWGSGAAGPVVLASPAALAVNEIICLPDKNLVLVLEQAPGLFSSDSFPYGAVPLMSTSDAFGDPWAPAYNHAHSGTSPGFATGAALREFPGQSLLHTNYSYQTGTVALLDGDHIAGVLSDTMAIRAKVAFGGQTPGTEEIRLFKDVKPSQFVQARFAASKFLALETATGGAIGNLLASVAIATLSRSNFKLALQVEGPKAFVTLSRDDGGPVFAPASTAQASIGVASDAAVAGAGVPAIAVAIPSAPGISENGYSWVESWEVSGVAPANLAAYDAYRVDGPDADLYRTASSGAFAGQKLNAQQRGAFPKAAPSTSSVAVVCMPFDQGPANDKISAVVSVRERFFYAR